MDEKQLNEAVIEFFKAFSNLERLRIAGLLVNESLTPGQVAERLGMPIKEATNHLGYLAHWGYLKNVANTYQLDKETWTALSRQVLENSRPRSKAEDFEGEAFERKVLKDFISPDGRLVAVPTQQKKRLVIMHYIVQVFEPGARYPEKQVNELLKRYNPDTASLRRYLVDDGLLQRESGIYWLTESQS
jgi:hypothetical protein